jgi:hypothetical protein
MDEVEKPNKRLEMRVVPRNASAGFRAGLKARGKMSSVAHHSAVFYPVKNVPREFPVINIA